MSGSNTNIPDMIFGTYPQDTTGTDIPGAKISVRRADGTMYQIPAPPVPPPAPLPLPTPTTTPRTRPPPKKSPKKSPAQTTPAARGKAASCPQPRVSEPPITPRQSSPASRQPPA